MQDNSVVGDETTDEIEMEISLNFFFLLLFDGMGVLMGSIDMEQAIVVCIMEHQMSPADTMTKFNKQHSDLDEGTMEPQLMVNVTDQIQTSSLESLEVVWTKVDHFLSVGGKLGRRLYQAGQCPGDQSLHYGGSGSEGGDGNRV